MITNSTLLHYACLSNNVQMVKLLLSNGADKTITNDCNETALYYASDKSIIDIVNVSIKVQPPPKERLASVCKPVETDKVRKGMASIKQLMELKKKKNDTIIEEEKRGSSYSTKKNSINDKGNDENNSDNNNNDTTKNDYDTNDKIEQSENKNDNDKGSENSKNIEKPIVVMPPSPPPLPTRPPPPLPQTKTIQIPGAMQPNLVGRNLFSDSFEMRLKEEKRKQNEERREQQRKDEVEKAERLRVEELTKQYKEAKKKEDSNHEKFVGKIYDSLRPLNKFSEYHSDIITENQLQINQESTERDSQLLKKLIPKKKKSKPLSRSARIWQTTTCSELSFPRDIESAKMQAYEYGLKKFVEEFKQLAFQDDSWVIVRRKSLSLANRSSSVPPRRSL